MLYPDRVEAARERAAIMEFDGGLSREVAEERAAAAWRVAVEHVRQDVRGTR